VNQLRAQTAVAVRTPALLDYAPGLPAAARERAVAALQQTGPSAEQVIVTELRDASGALLLTTNAAMSARVPAVRYALSDSVIVGGIVFNAATPDTLAVAIVARIPHASPERYFVRWRRLVGSRRTREQMQRLVGSGASMFLGTIGEPRWTNLEQPVPPPPVQFPTAQASQRYERGATPEEYVASVAAVAGTPWTVVVDMPMQLVLAPVHQFFWHLALIVGVLLAGTLAAVWAITRRLTTPLRQLTRAASLIATGDYSQRGRVAGSDELGQLGRAFDSMAQQVQEGHDLLELRIADRTRELRDAQESLVRRERLAMLGQLSSGVGHELRNPLGVMTNAVYFLRAVLTSPPPKVKEYLDILQQQITLSEKIISDLLDFARSRPPQRKPTVLLEAVQTQLDRIGRPEGVDIAFQIADYLPDVLVDPVQLGQIVVNLVTNASQAMQGTGRIALHAVYDGSQVMLEVSDTGPGIAPENLDKIFEPLFTTKARGIGLGLSVSRMLARANGGDLTVQSVVGAGATFRLTLPAVAAMPAGVA
jgi:signal transduction histidine kinase